MDMVIYKLNQKLRSFTIDIHAFKQEKSTIDFQGARIHFMSHILAECKYSSNRDLFVFESLTKAGLDRLPLRINGENLCPISYLDFELPTIIEKIIEVKVGDISKKEFNLTDHITHKACEQIMEALSYFYNRQIERNNLFYYDSVKNTRIFKEWQKFVDTNEDKRVDEGGKSKFPDKVINDFLKNTFESTDLAQFPSLYIHLCFPFLIVDENRGVIKITLDRTNEISDFEDIGYGIYPYTSENANKYEDILQNSFSMPIFVLNLTKIDDCIKIIEEGIQKITNLTEKQIRENPWLVPKEFIFGQTEYRMPNGTLVV